jgi:hypothetical protein
MLKRIMNGIKIAATWSGMEPHARELVAQRIRQRGEETHNFEIAAVPSQAERELEQRPQVVERALTRGAASWTCSGS